mmetsp:Transcript_27553/g.84500  ORF Transcript_27553/g.84500 Transcript_27553/m.84500 type:complete len:344 (+) Transcript_27553:1298-2329(+)
MYDTIVADMISTTTTTCKSSFLIRSVYYLGAPRKEGNTPKNLALSLQQEDDAPLIFLEPRPLADGARLFHMVLPSAQRAIPQRSRGRRGRAVGGGAATASRCDEITRRVGGVGGQVRPAHRQSPSRGGLAGRTQGVGRAAVGFGAIFAGRRTERRLETHDFPRRARGRLRGRRGRRVRCVLGRRSADRVRPIARAFDSLGHETVSQRRVRPRRDRAAVRGSADVFLSGRQTSPRRSETGSAHGHLAHLLRHVRKTYRRVPETAGEQRLLALARLQRVRRRRTLRPVLRHNVSKCRRGVWSGRRLHRARVARRFTQCQDRAFESSSPPPPRKRLRPGRLDDVAL